MSDQKPQYLGTLPDHGRFPYSGISHRENYRWPNGSGLAVYLALNLEHFAFGQGMGAAIGPLSPQPDVLNYSWREYGNRVGAWRCLDLFQQLKMPFAALINTALYDHCPELVQACVAQSAELVGHGHSNAERQGGWPEEEEKNMLRMCQQLIQQRSGQSVRGWLSPWISESFSTPDLLAETGYTYTLNWCHDDQPIRMTTRNAKSLWSIPYPQELNDIPMIVGRQLDGKDFAQMLIDQFDEMLAQSRHQPLVMGIALHPYLVGQPYRLRHLRRALQHMSQAQQSGDIWMTTPGEIAQHVTSGL
jgi:allantoinase